MNHTFNHVLSLAVAIAIYLQAGLGWTIVYIGCCYRCCIAHRRRRLRLALIISACAVSISVSTIGIDWSMGIGFICYCVYHALTEHANGRIRLSRDPLLPLREPGQYIQERLCYQPSVLYDDVLRIDENLTHLIDQFRVTAKSHSFNRSEALEVTLENRTVENKRWIIPEGTVFESTNRREQNLIVRDPVSGELPPNAHMRLFIFAYCGNAGKNAPDARMILTPFRYTGSLSDQFRVSNELDKYAITK